MSKKVLKLDTPDTIDFLVAGIICGFRNYRVCIELNEMFGFGLNRVSDITIPTGRLGSNTIHAKYVGESSDLDTCIFVANKDIYNTGHLIPFANSGYGVDRQWRMSDHDLFRRQEIF